MATLETQYRNFKIDNPSSRLSFEEWREDRGKRFERAIKELEEKDKDKEDECPGGVAGTGES